MVIICPGNYYYTYRLYQIIYMACCGGIGGFGGYGGFGLFNGLGLNAQPGLCSSYGGGGCCYNPSYGGLAYPTWAWGFGPGCWPIAANVPIPCGGGLGCDTSRRHHHKRRHGRRHKKNRVQKVTHDVTPEANQTE